MGTNNAVFLEVIEWFDESGQEMLHRIPEEGSGEIKFGAQLTVRESQAAILFYKGRAGDAFGAGRHTLKTGNIPILTKILSTPWGMTSPLRAEVYFANLKIFTGLKWGTRDPIAFRDSELGLIRLRAHGIFNLRITQPALFINTMAGTMGKYTTECQWRRENAEKRRFENAGIEPKKILPRTWLPRQDFFFIFRSVFSCDSFFPQ